MSKNESSASPLLSIIMPCYNVADTIERALESILMQVVDFPYEIIMVEDCSTDNTLQILKTYAQKHEHINLILHEENCGNAHSFYDGLCAAQGEFFCVLDGDDYYTHQEKFQLQIDFFREDTLGDYVATTHYFVYDLCDGTLSISPRTNITEFTYPDFLVQQRLGGYYHTSTYMFRNIFRGCVPEHFKEIEFRGDTPRTVFHLQASNKKVKILNFVGSAYAYTCSGIWSGMTQEKQKDYQIRMLENLSRTASTPFEQSAYEKRIKDAHNLDWSGDSYRRYLPGTIDYYLLQLRRLTSILAFHQKKFVLESLYYSQYVDSLCATLGYVNTVYDPQLKQQESNEERLAIVVGALNPKGGGVFQEIVELIEMYSDKEIMLLVTDMACEEITEYAYERLSPYPQVTISAAPYMTFEKLQWLSNKMVDFSPAKAYYYASHCDPYSQALMQSGVCKNVCLFSFDHGFICGISNPNLDCIVAKRPLDYTMLSKYFGDKVIFVPAWSKGIDTSGKTVYEPYKNHTELITASGAARFYKLDMKPPNAYVDVILELLEHTKGKHYHFGPIPEEKLEYIHEYLREHELAEDAFVHIEWSQNMLEDLLENEVDLFVEPFPVVSYKMTLEVLAGGIPIIAHEGVRRMNKLDFIYPGNLTWKTKVDFVETASNLTVQQLKEHSRLSQKYFQETHAMEAIAPFLRQDKSFFVPEATEAVDASLREVRLYEKTFKKKDHLDLLSSKKAELELAKRAIQREKTAVVLRNTKRSASYRIGHAVLFPLGFVRKLVSNAKKSNIFNAVRTTWKKRNPSNDHLEPQAVLNSLRASKAWFIGRALTYPYRKLFKKPARAKQTKKENQIHGASSPFDQQWQECFSNIARLEPWRQTFSNLPETKDCSHMELYTIYRALQYLKPKRILEFGVTSGTTLVDTYLQDADDAHCVLVDLSADALSKYRESKQHTIVEDGTTAELSSLLELDSFDLVIVHGFANEGRIATIFQENITQIIENISQNFAILLSDLSQRAFSINARIITEAVSNDRANSYVKGKSHTGEKNLKVWCSKRYRALANL